MKITIEKNWFDDFKTEAWVECGVCFVRTPNHSKYAYCFSIGFILFTFYLRGGKKNNYGKIS